MPRRPSSKSKSRSTSNAQAKATSQLRIIGGEWRSRKIPFIALEGVRPTTDRVRETVFNWLQGATIEARCLDLFAGSGALGLEALSRGAKHCRFIDLQSEISKQLKANLNTLKCSNAEVITASVSHWLSQPNANEPYSLVFLDPPFNKQMAAETCQQLEQGGFLAQRAWIYVETEAALTALAVPANWQEHRSKTSGDVCSRLYLREAVDKA